MKTKFIAIFLIGLLVGLTGIFIGSLFGGVPSGQDIPYIPYTPKISFPEPEPEPDYLEDIRDSVWNIEKDIEQMKQLQKRR